MLTRDQFYEMSFKQIAEYHQVDEQEFIRQAYPPELVVPDINHWYSLYCEWHGLTQNPLAKALK